MLESIFSKVFDKSKQKLGKIVNLELTTLLVELVFPFITCDNVKNEII